MLLVQGGRLCATFQPKSNAALDLDEVQTPVSAGAGADFVALTVAVVVGVALDGPARVGADAHNDSGMGPVGSRTSDQEEAARPGLRPVHKPALALGGRGQGVARVRRRDRQRLPHGFARLFQAETSEAGTPRPRGSLVAVHVEAYPRPLVLAADLEGMLCKVLLGISHHHVAQRTSPAWDGGQDRLHGRHQPFERWVIDDASRGITAAVFLKILDRRLRRRPKIAVDGDVLAMQTEPLLHELDLALLIPFSQGFQ